MLPGEGNQIVPHQVQIKGYWVNVLCQFLSLEWSKAWGAGQRTQNIIPYDSHVIQKSPTVHIILEG